ncbi:MAG: hypothetical protein ACYCST_12655 [Acidimicrobiales bacterium]
MTIDAGQVAAAPLAPFIGQGWRHVAPRCDLGSGEGARIHGGLFTPPGSFPVLYLVDEDERTEVAIGLDILTASDWALARNSAPC